MTSEKAINVVAPNHLQKAICIVGSTYKLADKLGCRQSRVSMWLSRGRVPAEQCLAIEAATEGQVTRYQLRPDVFGEAPAGEKQAA